VKNINFRKARRYLYVRPHKKGWRWVYAEEQWLDLGKIYWADKSRLPGTKFPQSRILIIGFVVKDGVVHARRLHDDSFSKSFGTHCGLIQLPCLQCFSVHKPKDLPMCEACRAQLERFMDPAEAQRQSAARKEMKLEELKAKQERRRARKLELAQCQPLKTC
jgi:hypothetical protein